LNPVPTSSGGVKFTDSDTQVKERKNEMSMEDLIEKAEFLVDAEGKKRAVVVDIKLWEELVTLLEDLEDAAEIQYMRGAGEETVDWKQAKKELRMKGLDV
jgi:hypothetical protein